MKIAIMNHDMGDIEIMDLPKECQATTESVERFLISKGYDLDVSSYMFDSLITITFK